MTIPSTGITDAAPSATPASPAPRPAPVPEHLRALDALLCGLVLLFAFLVSSFVIRNSDFWFHLASGRLLAGGQYVFGVDPFCCTTAGVYWANHSWLFDWLLYLLHAVLGPAGLVALKAALVTLLAAALLHIRLPDGCRAVSAGCTALTLLAASLQLTLQPLCLSYLLLGLLLWLLWRYQKTPRPEEPTTFPQELRRLRWVLVLLVLWVNVDSWFLMGLFVIALFWVGSWFDPRVSCPAWLLPAAVAVCVLNPHHFHAFTWPAELSSVPWTSGLRLDPRFQGQFLAPWQLGPHVRPAAAVNLGQWAFVLLVLLGLLSFVAVRHDLSGWRGAVWLGLAVVGGWQLSLMPFFAVAAAPITALNFQQWLHQRGRAGPLPALLGRLALLAACLGLIGLTWRGWLHGFHDHGRRIAWGAEPNPSLERAGQQLADWVEKGLVPADAHVFTTHPEAAHYLAWLAPGLRSFLDHRWPLFAQTARDFEVVCRAIDLEAVPGLSADPQAPERVFPAFDIAYALVYDPQPDHVVSAQHRLVGNPQDWTLLDIDGLAVLYGCNGGEPGRHADLAFRPEEKAFAESQEDALWTAPSRGPAAAPQPSAAPAPGPSWELSAASLCLVTHLELARQAQRRQMVPPSPALLLLAIRAARRALAADPRDARAYRVLAHAYSLLHDRSAGPFQEPASGVLDDLRTFQIAAVLENALRIQPDHPATHQVLANLYNQHRYFDIALDHQRELVGLLEAAGPSEALTGAEQEQQRLEKEVQKQQEELLRQAADLGEDPLPRARLALRLGLPRQALEDILLPAGAASPGTPVFTLQMQLLLILGRADEVRDRIHAACPEGPEPGDDWILARACAACGDYEEAEALVQGREKRLSLLEQADRAAVAALLALEQGKPIAARASFEKAVELLGPGLPKGERQPRLRLARAYLGLLDRAR